MENVKEIERIVKEGMIVEVDGKKYSASNLRAVVDDRSIKPVILNTLTGLVNFFMANIDNLDLTKLLCIVNSHKDIAILTNIDKETRLRNHIVGVQLMDDGHKFNFGQFMDHEEFVIKLKSLFVENEDQIKLMSFVSRLTVQNNVEVQDDGISQSATLRKGISGAVKTNEVAPVVVQLRPYRTFNEVTQPSSGFLFRMRTDHNKNPQCALFEADGGAWRSTAMESIQKYLQNAIDGLTVIA